MRLGLEDIAVYRALFPRQEARFWGSESIVDPRITPSEIGRRTGMSRSAIQVRLRRWREVGFWNGYEVWPNPRLFGVSLATIDVPASSPAAVDDLLEALRMIEGVVSARDLLDETGRTVRAYVIQDGSRGLERRRRLIARVAGVSGELPCHDYWVPEFEGSLSRLDWKIVAYYRAFPEAELSRASSDLGITPKTLTRRRDRLLDSGAIWWLLSTNSELFSVAAFYARLAKPETRHRVKDELAALVQGWIPCADDGFGRRPSETLDVVAGLCFVNSPASMDRVARQILGIPGVGSVQWRVPREFRSYGEWIDRAIRVQISPTTSRTWIETAPIGPYSNRLAYFEHLVGESIGPGAAPSYPPMAPAGAPEPRPPAPTAPLRASPP
jgi:DNA-binding Lrp family transcriptional regulator